MIKNMQVKIHRYTSRLRTPGDHLSKFRYKSFMYEQDYK